MTLEELAARFRGPVKRDARGLTAFCPAHADGSTQNRPSLRLTETPATGGLHVKCWAGCEEAAILTAAGLTLADLSPPHRRNGSHGVPHAGRRIVATYDYQDTDGALAYQVVRYEPKDFRQRRPDGIGGWVDNMKGQPRLLYRLPALQGAPMVYITEGEKDVDALRALGLVATTNTGGSGKWTAADTAALLTAGVKAVVILPDNDPAGEQHAAKVSASCRGAGLEVRIVRLPGLGPKEDVSDWLGAGHTHEDLKALVLATPADDGASGGPADPAPPVASAAPHLTDAGNAQRFAREHAGCVRYAWGEKQWLVSDGRRWARDNAAGRVLELAKATAQRIYREAEQETDPDRRKQLARWAIASESESRLRAMLALAASEPGLPVATQALDADGFALNVENGTVDLKTGTLRAHRPVDLLTKFAPIAYDPKAECPRFLAFLDRIFGGRAALIDFLQRAIGYSLTADTSEQCLFVCHGTGGNGKSTLLRTLGDLFGDYARTTPAETLLVQRGESPRHDVRRLRGARLVTASEAEQGRRLAESLVKSITGSDVVAARALYQDFEEFAPTFKIWLAVNHLPRIAGTDLAIWRRVKLIPFTVTIPDAEQDRHLAESLRVEWPGILAWAVRGCLAWQRNGLGTSDEVRAATAAYRVDEDAVGPFLDERCVCQAGTDVPIATLYSEYRGWAETNQERTLSRREFLSRLLERDGLTRLRTGRARLVKGLRLRTEADADVAADAPTDGIAAVNPWR